MDIFSGRPYCLRITKVDSPLYAGNNLDKTQDIFAKAIKQATDQADDPAADTRASAVVTAAF